jgi:hypothetical protein
MAPKSGNAGGKNPHMRLIHGKNRFNGNTNVPVGHAGCQVSARARVDKERDKGVTRTVVHKSNAKGMFHCAE